MQNIVLECEKLIWISTLETWENKATSSLQNGEKEDPQQGKGRNKGPC